MFTPISATSRASSSSLSTFSAHMKTIVSIMDCCGQGDLVLFDELGAGTDPVEGAALAVAVIGYARQMGACVAATTHYAELKTLRARPPTALRTPRASSTCRSLQPDLPSADRHSGQVERVRDCGASGSAADHHRAGEGAGLHRGRPLRGRSGGTGARTPPCRADEGRSAAHALCARSPSATRCAPSAMLPRTVWTR